MSAQRDGMTLDGTSAPVLGVEERSDEAPSASRPNPEVVAKPKRRQFTAGYRLRILEEAERCTASGEVGRLLRREGLYSSHLTAWRKARRKGSLRGWPRTSAAQSRRCAIRLIRRCESSRRKWFVWRRTCTPRTPSWKSRETPQDRGGLPVGGETREPA